MKNLSIICLVCILVSTQKLTAQNTTVNGAVTYQTIHGLGVNINPQSWNVNPGAVKKVIDSLVNGLGCTSFRLMFDDCDWELVNDNNDPATYNWSYYDSIYSAPRFAGVWNTIEYLNSKGITDITLSPDGAAPKWMGVTKLIAGKEAEYAEMMSSMVYYGLRRRTPAIHFIMLSPVNETTCGGGEGAVMTPDQLGMMFTDVAKHLIQDSLKELSLIGPDDCQGWASNYHAIVSSPVAMSKVIRFGQHDYGNETKKMEDMVDSIKLSAYPDREAIMTEANAPCIDCDGGTYNKSYDFNYYAGPAYKDILQQLNAGANGLQIWEGYDSRYHHPNRTLTWSMWGIFGVNDTLQPAVYTARAHYYAFMQLFRFVKPGYQRIEVSTTLSSLTVSAYYNPANGNVVFTGKNNSDKEINIDAVFKNLSERSLLKFYYTDQTHNFFRAADVRVTRHSFSRKLPPNCVFTFISN